MHCGIRLHFCSTAYISYSKYYISYDMEGSRSQRYTVMQSYEFMQILYTQRKIALLYRQRKPEICLFVMRSSIRTIANFHSVCKFTKFFDFRAAVRSRQHGKLPSAIPTGCTDTKLSNVGRVHERGVSFECKRLHSDAVSPKDSTVTNLI